MTGGVTPLALGIGYHVHSKTVEFWLTIDGRRVGDPVFTWPDEPMVEAAARALPRLLEQFGPS